MRKENEVVGTIEDVVRDARLVDKGKEELNKRFYSNSPSFDPEKRKFLKRAAVLTGLSLLTTVKLLGLEGCAAPKPVTFQGQTYGVDWESWLMSQDLIRGPEPLYRPTGNLPFDNHLNLLGSYSPQLAALGILRIYGISIPRCLRRGSSLEQAGTQLITTCRLERRLYQLQTLFEHELSGLGLVEMNCV